MAGGRRPRVPCNSRTSGCARWSTKVSSRCCSRRRRPTSTWRASRDVRTGLVKRAARINLFLADDLAAGLTAFYELLSRWNRKINLTSLDDPDVAIDRLLLEPIAAARLLPAGAFRLMDVGSGGG